MKVAVIGTGHVGLITAVALAHLGHDVAGMDADARKVAELQAGTPPFQEPKLDDYLSQGLAAGRLRFTTEVPEAVSEAQVVFICVGRPPVGLGDRSLGAVEDAARAVARAATPGVVIVVKSTVPPGTSARIAQVVAKERPDLNFAVAASPEFLREGHAVDDTLEPDRLVVGSDDPGALETLRTLYGPIAERTTYIETDAPTAELSKLASNAFLATKISFANALARLSERSGADVGGVTAIMGADPRIGAAFLGAGLGYGGYCLPKDIVTLERLSDRLGYDFGLLREASRINEEALDAVVSKVTDAVWNVEGKRIALLGLAFKAGTDDVRGAPALALAGRLAEQGALVVGFDPVAGEQARAELPGLEIAPDPYAAVEGAAAAVICTEWAEFRDLDLERLAGLMVDAVLVDARNLLDPEIVRAAGFAYFPTGAAGG
ncbi:MAG: UDPglucose 6-dehydrogenase [Actinomycetota bacterium]|jgi:UDPglucose 6-dehydrogenase|nr:UDPglucose 6-dehydrogenase [Actinomycetota bacterium]